ncbi:MAG TPA: sugar ABC transporter permease [Gryllotalpicola sp.]
MTRVSAPTPPASRPTPAPASRRPAAPRRRRRGSGPLPYLLVAPASIMELLVHIVPMLLGVWIAFISLTQLHIANWLSAPFVGLHNFIDGLNPAGPIGSEFFSAVLRTVVFTVIVMAVSWVLAIFAAVMLSTSFRGRGFVRTLFIVPYALPAYVGTIAWAFIFSQENGVINTFLVDDLHLFGGKPPFWLLGPNSFFVICIVTIWEMWPFAFLMLLAALQSIPGEVYEAASLDGASLWKQFTRITLPLIRPANSVLLLVMGLWVFNQFNVPYVLFGATPPKEALLVTPLIYQNSFSSFNFGLGGAMSVLLMILLLVASLVYIRLALPREDPK